MKNEKLIEILQKEYDVDSRIKIHLHFGSGLNEKLRVVGTWNSEYDYTMDCTNYWSRGNLITSYHTVQDLIDLLLILPLDVRILGVEYSNNEYTGRKECLQRNIELVFNRRDHSFSSSSLRKRVAHSETEKLLKAEHETE